MFSRLDHVSIGVLDIERAQQFFCGVLGGERLEDAGSSPREGFSWVTFLLGGKKVELVTPHEPGEGGVGRYLARRGEGFHHLSFSVEDLDGARAYLEENDIRVIGYAGEGSFRHFYIHPADSFGALIQVFEETDQTKRLAE